MCSATARPLAAMWEARAHSIGVCLDYVALCGSEGDGSMIVLILACLLAVVFSPLYAARAYVNSQVSSFPGLLDLPKPKSPSQAPLTATTLAPATRVQLRALEREREATLEALDELALELASVPSGTLLHLTAASEGPNALTILNMLLR